MDINFDEQKVEEYMQKRAKLEQQMFVYIKNMFPDWCEESDKEEVDNKSESD